MRKTLMYLSLALLPACGAATAKFTVDDVALAGIPMAEKQAMFAAEQEISVAKAEKAKDLSDIDNTKRDLQLADAEHEQSKLEMQKAMLTIDAAEKSRDLNQQQAAQNTKRIAELGERASRAKGDAIDQRLSWQKALVDIADERIEANMAKAELEKAKLAVAKNILPSKDFKLDNFVNEVGKRDREVDIARANADKKKAKLDQMLQSQKDLQTQYDQQRGAPVSAAPPPAPAAAAPQTYVAPAPTTAPPPAAPAAH